MHGQPSEGRPVSRTRVRCLPRLRCRETRGSAAAISRRARGRRRLRRRVGATSRQRAPRSPAWAEHRRRPSAPAQPSPPVRAARAAQELPRAGDHEVPSCGAAGVCRRDAGTGTWRPPADPHRDHRSTRHGRGHRSPPVRPRRPNRTAVRTLRPRTATVVQPRRGSADQSVQPAALRSLQVGQIGYDDGSRTGTHFLPHNAVMASPVTVARTMSSLRQ